MTQSNFLFFLITSNTVSYLFLVFFSMTINVLYSWEISHMVSKMDFHTSLFNTFWNMLTLGFSLFIVISEYLV